MQTVNEWRLEKFLELGFSNGEASFLADAKKVESIKVKSEKRFYEHPLYWGDVRKMLEDGWTHGQILHEVL